MFWSPKEYKKFSQILTHKHLHQTSFAHQKFLKQSKKVGIMAPSLLVTNMLAAEKLTTRKHYMVAGTLTYSKTINFGRQKRQLTTSDQSIVDEEVSYARKNATLFTTLLISPAHPNIWSLLLYTSCNDAWSLSI